MARIGRKRLAMDIPIRIHEDLKVICKTRNVTITKYVLRLIYAKLHDERSLLIHKDNQ